MLYRSLTLAVMLIALAGCQTGKNDTDGALSSAVTETAADDVPSSTAQSDENDAASETVEEGAAPAKADAEPKPEKQSKPVAQTPSSNANIVRSVQQIAAIRKKKGERGAVESIFACYEKARKPDASIELAKVCAAIDFVVSREVLAKRPKNASGTKDRALVIAKRHAERIGALLQFKGMDQNAFNAFGKSLHSVAEPAYKKARKS